MNFLVRFFVFSCLLSTGVVAQITDQFKFHMEGSFQREEGLNLPPTRFTLRWNEVNDQITGTYIDNHYSPIEVGVAGLGLPAGRNFNIVLPDLARGARSIDIQLLAAGIVTGTVSATYTLRDSAGLTIDFFNVPVQVTTDETFTEGEIAADPTQLSCVVGMGALTGFCGTYTGTITQAVDGSNRCRHFINSSSRLELTTTGDFMLHIRPPFGAVIPAIPLDDNYTHVIGSLSGMGPLTTTVEIVGRNCGSLVGTAFPIEGCQTLTLSGNFSDVAEQFRFNGTYTMAEESSGEYCSYTMRLRRLE
jgi:hypothetical protein